MFVEKLDESGDESFNSVLLPDVNFHSGAIGSKLFKEGDRSFRRIHFDKNVFLELGFLASLNRSCLNKIYIR